MLVKTIVYILEHFYGIIPFLEEKEKIEENSQDYHINVKG
jgi:hypothetical protein